MSLADLMSLLNSLSALDFLTALSTLIYTLITVHFIIWFVVSYLSCGICGWFEPSFLCCGRLKQCRFKNTGAVLGKSCKTAYGRFEIV